MLSQKKNPLFSATCCAIATLFTYTAMADSEPSRLKRQLPETITLSVLLPQSGSLAQQGAEVKAALEQSKNDFNAESDNVALALTYHDTATDPTTAPALLSIIDGGPDNAKNLVLGPLSSGFLLASKNNASANNYLLYSYGSTSPEPTLRVAGDSIFRHIPDDSNQAPVLARHIKEQGISHITIFNRNDSWGTSLREATRTSLTSLGLTVTDATDISTLQYVRSSLDATSFAAELANSVKVAIDSNGSKTAVLALGFGEVADIMAAANSAMTSEGDTPLDEVRWFGIDLISNIVNDTNSRRFAESEAVRYTVSTVAPDRSHTDYPRIRTAIIDDDDVETTEPATYAYAAYDALQVLANTITDSNSTMTANTTSALPGISSRYNGLMGNGRLNEFGDLQANADSYEIRTLNAGQWVLQTRMSSAGVSVSSSYLLLFSALTVTYTLFKNP